MSNSQSIMPLQFLCPAIQRVVAPSPCPPSTSQPLAPAAHPLHALLQPILLTSRAASQKYHDRLSQLLAEENEPANDEEEYMCYAYQKDKTFEIDLQEEQDEDEVQERLKKLWLERMERREYVPRHVHAPLVRCSHTLVVYLTGSRSRYCCISSFSPCQGMTPPPPSTHSPNPQNRCRFRPPCRPRSQRNASVVRARRRRRHHRRPSRSRSASRPTWTSSRCGSSCAPWTARSGSATRTQPSPRRTARRRMTGTGCKPSARTSSNRCTSPHPPLMPGADS